METVAAAVEAVRCRSGGSAGGGSGTGSANGCGGGSVDWSRWWWLQPCGAGGLKIFGGVLVGSIVAASGSNASV